MAKFTKTDPFAATNGEAEDSIYGSRPATDIPASGRIVAKPVHLSQILRDPTQPRRAIPLSVTRGAPQRGTRAELQHWLTLVREEVGQYNKAIDPAVVLAGQWERPETRDDKGDQHPVTFTPRTEAYISLLGLASSILKDGLLNPITANQTEDGYVIETGERRFLAYSILSIYYDANGKWQQIPCQVVEKSTIRRMSAENTVRQDLNAIGKARQLFLLLMDCYPDIEFAPYDAFPRDRHYYAQAAELRVPRGHGPELLQTLGFPSREVWARHADLINLTDDQWDDADDSDSSERSLRDILHPSKDMLPTGNISTRPTYADMSTTVDISPPSPAAGFTPSTPPQTRQDASPVHTPSTDYAPPGSFRANVNTPIIQPPADPRTKPLDEFYPSVGTRLASSAQPANPAPTENSPAERHLPQANWDTTPLSAHPRAKAALIMLRMFADYAQLDSLSDEARVINWVYTLMAQYSESTLAQHITNGYTTQQYREDYAAMIALYEQVIKSLGQSLTAYADHVEAVMLNIEDQLHASQD